MKTHLFFALTLATGLATLSAQEEAADASRSTSDPVAAETTGTAASGRAAPEGPVGTHTESVETSIELPETAPSEENPLSGAEMVTPEETFTPGVDEPLPLMPDEPLPPSFEPLPEGGFITGGSPKDGTAEQLRQAIRIREARTRALQDPAVQAEKARADEARTYEGRRTALRNYYTLLYRRMVKLDASLKPALEKQLYTDLRRLEQRHVYPSQPVENIQPIPGSRSDDYKEKKDD